MNFKRYLLEGTWSAPSSVKKAKRFENLMESPIPCHEADDKLYGVVGNDTLFDEFLAIEDRGKDVRPIVAEFIVENWFPIENSEWSPKWDSQAIDIVRRTVKKHHE